MSLVLEARVLEKKELSVQENGSETSINSKCTSTKPPFASGAARWQQLAENKSKMPTTDSIPLTWVDETLCWRWSVLVKIEWKHILLTQKC